MSVSMSNYESLIEERDDVGRTELFNAIAWDEPIEVIQKLLDKGCDINSTDKYDDTVLYYCGQRISVNTLKFLVENGLKIVDRDLFYVCAYGKNEEVIKYLIEEIRLNINVTDIYGDNIAPHVVSNFELLKYLTEKGLNLHNLNDYGNNVMHYAMYRGDLKTIEFLIEKSVDYKHINNEGESVLFTALLNTDVNVLKKMISLGLDVNITSHENHTLLMYAVCQKNKKCIEVLLNHNIKTSFYVDNVLYTPFHLLKNWGKDAETYCPEIYSMIKEHEGKELFNS